MSIIIDPVSTFPMADPEIKPFAGMDISPDDVQKALKPMILSASGWRKVFAPDGDEESREESLNPADSLLAAAMAEAYIDFLFSRVSKPRPVVVIGLDARFTGPALADVMIRVLLSRGIEVRYLFISAAPELMGYTGQTPECDGFIYISASHNPIGHNGVKFGLSTGGVLSGEEAAELIGGYKNILADHGALETLMARCDSQAVSDIETVYNSAAEWKKESYAVYSEFSSRVMSGLEDEAPRSRFIDSLKKGIEANPIAVVAELNGSARTLTVDKEYLENLGVKVKIVNGKPRQITHRIVPEGESLDLCRSVLQDEATTDPAFQLGYVPDNDGDRGNLVFFSKRDGKAHILEAQEVFALSVLSELAYLYWNEGMTDQTGVGINGPTSGRIEEICEAFGCTAFRAEVGEANVVNLAGKKRDEGWQIRILGEGSNGGNITWPAAVRDPLNTLGALLKLLVLRTTADKSGLFEIWCHLSGQSDKYRTDFDLQDVIESLPAYTTTSAFEARAMMKITGMDHGLLKKNYEEVFAQNWESRKDELFERFGIVSWEEWNQEGTSSVQGVGSEFRSGAETGGLTIRFLDSEGGVCGFIWMRGSGTEPVFRVLADWRGDNPEAEAYLLDWHKEMIAIADKVLL
jgi:phosphoglucomutase